MESVLLVGVNTDGDPGFDHSMEELGALAEAAGMEVCGCMVQNMPAIHKSLYVGTGKVTEIITEAGELEATLLLLNDSLTPSQLRNLQDETGLAVMDRTTLILEIFSSRARTKEAMLQVEVARLQYLLPRLVGLHDALSRQGGTSGAMSSRGAGEKKLELDRRRLQSRLTELQRELKLMEADKETQMKKREKSGIPRVALVGYTNAGKSTIMNVLIDKYLGQEEKKVLQKDMLFATLDTTVRSICPRDNKTILLSDTVGFIDKLPHGLVKAFRSTLAEAAGADLILHVVDYSDPFYKMHMQVTKETLAEVGAADIPVLYVYNKVDLANELATANDGDAISIPKVSEYGVYMAAGRDIGVEALVDEILKRVYASLKKVNLLLPFQRGDLFSYLKENANVLSYEYKADGIEVVAEVSTADAGRLAEFTKI